MKTKSENWRKSKKIRLTWKEKHQISMPMTKILMKVAMILIYNDVLMDSCDGFNKYKDVYSCNFYRKVYYPSSLGPRQFINFGCELYFSNEDQKLSYYIAWFDDHPGLFQYFSLNETQKTIDSPIVLGLIEDSGLRQSQEYPNARDKIKIKYRCISISTKPLFKLEINNNFHGFIYNCNCKGSMCPNDLPVVPTEGPFISKNISRTAVLGDVIMVKCTSAPSRPKAIINWYMDLEKIYMEGVIEFHKDVEMPDNLFVTSQSIYIDYNEDYIEVNESVTCISFMIDSSLAEDDVTPFSSEWAIDWKEYVIDVNASVGNDCQPISLVTLLAIVLFANYRPVNC